jgi:trk system potassium uptake protein TrkH
MTAYILGQIAILEAILLIPSFGIALGYGESATYLAFGITLVALLALGIPLVLKKPVKSTFHARGGFLVVAIAWIQLSLFGSLPFVISGAIPNFIDALFESVSAFTTTGASILIDPTTLPYSLAFWALTSQWIGGMGILVFVVAIIPKNDPAAVHLIRAESPGPQFGKLVSKLKFSARILYSIYIAITLLLIGLLLCGGVSLFDSITLAFGTASTGGYSFHPTSVASFNNLYVEIVISIFMVIFSVNFNLFFFILIGHFKQAIKNEELRWLFSIFFVSTLAISISNFAGGIYSSFADSLRYSSFQVISVGSTSGFTTADFSKWTGFSQAILLILMFIGGSSGSAAGGFKVSRLIIMLKTCLCDIRKTISPRSTTSVKMDGKLIPPALTASVSNYFGMYIIIILVSTLLISLVSNFNLFANFSSVVSATNNIGPAIGINELVSYANFPQFAKFILTLDMLIGRLEILPILLLFYPKAYRP